MPNQNARSAMILSTDCGVEMDDQWAISHLALSPEFDLRGIVSAQAPVLATADSSGNLGPQVKAPSDIAEATAAAARSTLSAMPIDVLIPVYAGSNTRLENRVTPAPSVGADFIVNASQGFTPDNRLSILVIGPATDVASALLLDPSIENRISIVAMAFNTWPEGTDLFNVKNDIAAWQVLMASRSHITIGDWAVCKTHLKMNRSGARSLFSDLGQPGQYLINLISSWLDHQSATAEALVDDSEAWAVWDQVTVAHMLGLTTVRIYPRPELQDDMSFSFDGIDRKDSLTINWITEIDEDALWNDFRSKLGRAMNQRDEHPDGE